MKVACFFLGHKCKPVLADRNDPNLSLDLLMYPNRTLKCARCGAVIPARAKVVTVNGLDYVEIRPK